MDDTHSMPEDHTIPGISSSYSDDSTPPSAAGPRRFNCAYRVESERLVRTVSVNSHENMTWMPKVHGDLADADPAANWDQAYLRANSPPVSQSWWGEVRGVDLFCGCGGLSLGLTEACRAVGLRFLPVLAVDLDRQAIDVYRRNFDPVDTHFGDVRDLVDGDLDSVLSSTERATRRRVGPVAVLLAGPPCQGHSNLNNHTRREDNRNLLYDRVARFAQIVEPRFVLIENVPTVVHSREGVLERTVDRLQRLGYDVDCGRVDLTALGVPQLRTRHLLIAGRPLPLRVEDVTAAFAVPTRTTVGWAIADIADQEGCSAFDTAATISPENKKRIRHLFKHDLVDLPNELRPSCHRDKTHSYNAMYGRLRSGGPAQTVTTGFNSPGQGRYVHPTRQRTITPHEAARLQFFPDFFDFSAVPYRNGLSRLIGNAVPMKLGYAYGLQFLREIVP